MLLCAPLVRSPGKVIGMAPGATPTSLSRRCVPKVDMKSLSRSVKLLARSLKSTLQSMERAMTSASLASMRPAASKNSSMVLPIAVHPFASLAQLRRTDADTWRIVVQLQIVIHIVLQQGSSRQRESAWKPRKRKRRKRRKRRKKRRPSVAKSLMPVFTTNVDGAVHIHERVCLCNYTKRISGACMCLNTYVACPHLNGLRFDLFIIFSRLVQHLADHGDFEILSRRT
mmetsp:Transcript_57530/g.105818  ORF Transcript_57530/g.105818 Transcript_57530/m.105818 type:complete len:228 (-) Transcript_57530:123-806(-)